MGSINNNFGIVGRVGEEVTTTEKDGKTTAKFSVASNYKRGETEKTTWFNVTVFGKLAEVVAKNVNKGDQVAINGHMSNNNFEKDGVKHYQMSFIADEVLFLTPKGEEA